MTTKVAESFAKLIGITTVEALVLCSYRDDIGKATDEYYRHSTENNLEKINKVCNKFDCCAKRFGFGTHYPGIYPVLIIKDGKYIDLPE